MRTFSRSGLTFDVADSGPAAGEAVILLHGFPQTSAAWDAVVPALNAQGYRTLAPDQRGYSPGARPRGRAAYRSRELVADVLALADAAGVERFHLVGHDWGGAVGWALAGTAPDRLHSLTVVSTPHPRALFRSLVTSDQALRSWYMSMFQLPVLPEWLLLASGGRLAVRSLAASGLPAERARGYVDRLRQPGALTAAIDWYRALPLDARSVRSLPKITVPTLYVWGTLDVALGRVAAVGTGREVSAPYRFIELPGVSHWIPESAPGPLVESTLAQLSSTGPRG